MKITCEHCGCGIDVDKDDKCPNCGAPYSDNKELKELKEYHRKNKEYNLKEREMNIRTKEMATNMIENTFKGQKVGLIIFAIIFIAALISMVTIFTKQIGKDIDSNKSYNGVYNEFVGGKSFEIKCDGIEKVETSDSLFGSLTKPKENYSFYKFHILVKNKSDDWINLNDINLTYIDENGNEDIMAKRANTFITDDILNYFATDKMTYSGYVVYEIPDYVENVNIKLDNTVINIDNFKENL